MPRFKALVFIKIALKLLFLQKNAKFSSAGGSAPRPQKHPSLRIFGYAPGVEGENLKSHAMTSLEIFEKKDFL